MTRDPLPRCEQPEPRGAWRPVCVYVLLSALALLPTRAFADPPPNIAFEDDRAKAIAAQKPAVLSLKDALFHDVASPVVGDPEADVTIVAFVDYNSPSCRNSEADLGVLVVDDPKIRVIYKDLPMAAKSSVKAAKVAIAAAWQGKYAEVHKALMQMAAMPATDADITKAVVASGINVTRLNKDLARRDGEIVALLKRNIQEADALKLSEPPVYLIGPFMTASALNLPQFKQIVADAREDQAKPVDATDQPPAADQQPPAPADGKP